VLHNGSYQTIPSPSAEYTTHCFPDASRISQLHRQPVVDAMNGIIAVNWHAAEPTASRRDTQQDIGSYVTVAVKRLGGLK
jgi:hypothetical protein